MQNSILKLDKDKLELLITAFGLYDIETYRINWIQEIINLEISYLNKKLEDLPLEEIAKKKLGKDVYHYFLIGK